VDDGRFSVQIETPAGSSLDYTAAKIRQVDAVLKRSRRWRGPMRP
jgi:HAE1 family hydrophobic/amphiphilic exporter-1